MRYNRRNKVKGLTILVREAYGVAYKSRGLHQNLRVEIENDLSNISRLELGTVDELFDQRWKGFESIDRDFSSKG